MSAPTQQLPPWLSFTTITAPHTTETSLVYLPLTYFGPSIPLGTNWVYGGLTSPVSTSTVATTSTTSATSHTSSRQRSSTTTSTTSAISTSSSATPSASSTLFSISSTPTASSTLSSIPSTPTVSSTRTASPSSSASASASALPTVAASTSPLTRAQLIGVVVGSILGSLVIFLLLLCCCLRFCERRGRSGGSRTSSRFTLLPRRRRGRTRFTMVTPPGQMEEIDDWQVVASPTSPQSPREPGRGATEADPFLAATGTAAQPLPNPHGATNSGNNSNSASSRGTASTSASSGTNTSGYGVLLEHPTLRLPPPPDSSVFPPPGAAAEPQSADNLNVPLPGRRILSPAQMATLVEEDDMDAVLPRPSMDGAASHISEAEEGEVVVARRVPVRDMPVPVPSPTPSPAPREARRSWIPRFSWLRDSRNSREMDIEEEGGLLLFDSGRGHSPSNSLSSPSPALLDAPRLASPSPPPPSTGEMREFGARPLLPFLARPLSSHAAHPDSRPLSGVSGMSSDGTTGSAKSGGTVYTDAKETLSSQASRSSARLGNRTNAQPAAQDPLDLPAPAPLAAFASSSQHSLHHVPSGGSTHGSTSASQQTATLGGNTTSNTSLATTAGGISPLKPERAYAHPPPGLGSFTSFTATSSSGKWDPADLELGFSRPASHDKLGTFGSANAHPVPVVPGAFAAPGIRIVGASTNSGLGSGAAGSLAPHLSLDLDDAPPGAEGGWRLLGAGGSQTSLLGRQEWGAGHDEGGAGRRGTFGGAGSGAAQYHFVSGPSSEHGSFHSRVGTSVHSASLSSGSKSAHAQGASGSTNPGHSLYPSSESGSLSNNSARARAMMHAGSVEGPMSPATSAFGHRLREAGDHSGSSGSGNSRRQDNSSAGRSRSPPLSPLMAPWVGGLAPEWRAT